MQGGQVCSLVQETDPACRMAQPKDKEMLGFPGGLVVKNLLATAGDTGSIPGWGGSQYHRAAKPMRHNYWAGASRAWELQLQKTKCPRASAPREKPLQWSLHKIKSRPRSLQLEKAAVQQWSLSAAK